MHLRRRRSIYITSFCLLPVHQSAYWKFHSTETVLLKMVTDLKEAIDCFVYSISLPPSIQWTIMFWPRACRGHMGSARPGLIGFALVSAIAYRQSSSTGSFQPSVCCGVPRGSVLGPLLFLLHLGELAVSLGLSHFFAEDSHLYTWGPPSTVAQQRRRMDLGVQRIAEWMRSNRLMRLNPEKSLRKFWGSMRHCAGNAAVVAIMLNSKFQVVIRCF